MTRRPITRSVGTRRRGRRLSLCAAACAGAIFAGAAVASTPAAEPSHTGGQAVKGDRAAYEQVLAAFNSLRGLRGYRVHQTAYRDSSLINDATFEAAPPDAVHIVSRMSPTVQIEAWRVGAQYRTRFTERGVDRWDCSPDPSLALPSGPAGGNGAVEMAAPRETRIEGLPGREYHYVVRTLAGGRTLEDRVVLRVYTQTGLPREYVQTFGDGLRMVQQFYDYGAKITIRLQEVFVVHPDGSNRASGGGPVSRGPC